MGTECIGARLTDDLDGIPSFPPGFAPSTSIPLQGEHNSTLASPCASNTAQSQVEIKAHTTPDEKYKKSLRHRPLVNYRQYDDSSEEESSGSELFQQDMPSICCLPKGVIRGFADNQHCQKVAARWRPEDACRPVLDEAPVFRPNEEEFKDTLKYIASIRPKAEKYGICRIIPPPSWCPPCPLKDKSIWKNSKFATRIQRVDKLQNRHSVKNNCRDHSNMKRKRRKLMRTEAECRSTDENLVDPIKPGFHSSLVKFGFEPGPDFTLEAFQKYADDFKDQYFGMKDVDSDLKSAQLEPSSENIEGEYWRIIEKPTEEIEVLYGADLETGAFGSGFPKASSPPTSDLENQYVKSGWNLNNLARLPGSVLSFENGDISGVLVPWLYVGMCFSSFCWHVEDHHLYSLNYLHWGAPKVWYGVPGREALKLEASMKKHLADLFEEQPDLLHNLVTQFSPTTLKSEGVPVYRCVQHPGEFILTFPRAYHSGFNCGFNCAEAVNVAPIDWLPHGQNAVELYHEQRRKISISHDKLLLGAAREAVRAQWDILFLRKNSSDNLRWKDACGVDGILAKALKARIEMERVRREGLCSPQSRKMDANFDSNSERECIVCQYDLHLSAVGCPCSSDRFACLKHEKQLCSCTWSTRFVLYRYEINELNVLSDALGGKLSAIHRWGLSDLGLSLSSHVTKDKVTKPVNRASSEIMHQKQKSQPCQDETPGEKTSASSEENKASFLLPSFVGVPREKEKVTVCADSTYITPDPSSMNQQSKSLSMSITKNSILQEMSPAEVDKSLQSRLQCRRSELSSSCFSGCENSQGGIMNSNLSDNTNNEQKSRLCSGFVPVVKHFCSPNNLLSNRDNSMTAADDVVKSPADALHEGSQKSRSDDVNEEPFVKSSEPVTRLANFDCKLNSCSSQKDIVLVMSETNAALICRGDNDSLSAQEKSSNLTKPVSIKAEDYIKQGTCQESLSILQNQKLVKSSCQNKSHSQNSIGAPILKQNSEFSVVKEESEFNITEGRSYLQHLRPDGSVKTDGESKDGKPEPESGFIVNDRGDSVTVSSSCLENSSDRHNRLHKGPRLAKVVRRMNWTVEPLEYGVVMAGRLWSTSQAIFPKGFRSRVRYFSVFQPTQMCQYINQILDAGLLGPLFMVAIEHCPREVFIHVSATKCWDMVRERVNQEIRKQHSLGKANLPSLQAPGSLDGLDMFGLTSPNVVQAIEAIDRDHVCSEYWKSRPQPPTRPVVSASIGCQVPDLKEELGTGVALRSLFKKANPNELHLLHSILTSDQPGSKQDFIKSLNEEIENCHRSTFSSLMRH